MLTSTHSNRLLSMVHVHQRHIPWFMFSFFIAATCLKCIVLKRNERLITLAPAAPGGPGSPSTPGSP